LSPFNYQHLDTVCGKKLRVNLHTHFGQIHALGTVQCARIIENYDNVCGGKLHIIDRVLNPPSGNVLEILRKDHSQFSKLIEFANLGNDISDTLNTVLAPLDSAFEKLDDDIKSKIFEMREVAESVVRNHIVDDALCCAGVKWWPWPHLQKPRYIVLKIISKGDNCMFSIGAILLQPMALSILWILFFY
jgi:uncharacterized surface protein with fasciclin (FAS1) repeats